MRPGSSPLARGLPPLRSGAERNVGIIPARAGFTGGGGRRGRTGGDHPRSRGGYSAATSAAAPAAGSSPLARGLQALDADSVDVLGIIPARAGFTARAGAIARGRRDHPRSRGVYIEPPPAVRRGPGSSPLARGLQSTKSATVWRQGIIPARAGFTAWFSSLFSLPQDHPRSRGVYAYFLRPVYPHSGSSPLARGLPTPPSGGRHSRWIIPARAGFT